MSPNVSSTFHLFTVVIMKKYGSGKLALPRIIRPVGNFSKKITIVFCLEQFTVFT